ncbi:BadF/BadG/BcrA/BcrD ATPase family protein [Microlunatus endophyticus]|uniref:BadF/BadG/BcrA/BcrD ATPase family protein n=1 Tax=Microlunatus endophyticus TaxID=1716077 RepID=UPI0016652E40|nr:BadF/BadG/BcrA/BcrD ATPase family protein [Microlunatus endophyticus]
MTESSSAAAAGQDRTPYVIAIDAGGTNTRVGCFGPDATLVGSAIGRGGSPNHNHDGAQQIGETVRRAIAGAGLDPATAQCVSAGVAGCGLGEREGDPDAFLDLPELACPKILVNDAVIAHRGALLGRPGVIVVGGTGSMILAITEAGEQIESGRLEHYAGGARHLVFDAMQRILLGRAGDQDVWLVDAILDHWQVATIGELRRRMVDQGGLDRNEVKRKYGDLAPLITGAADRSPLAAAAVATLATRTADGVRLLAPLIGTDPVAVALVGSVATANAFVDRFAAAVAPESPSIRIVPAALDPLRGAALMAYEQIGWATAHFRSS